MSDYYSEVLVKRENTGKDTAIRAGLIGGTAAALGAGLFVSPLFLLGAVGLTAAGYFVFPRLNVEYEYLFVNGELDVDMILGQSKRKRLKSFQMEEADLIAPLDSKRIDYYRENAKMKTFDYSSGAGDHKRYMMIVRDAKEGTCRVIFEPGEELANIMKRYAPSKVFLD